MTWSRMPSPSELAMTALAALVAGFLLGRCTSGGSPQEKIVIKDRHVPVRVAIPGMDVEKTTTTYVFTAADTSGTGSLVRQRDSLRLLLKERGARLVWGLDTITPSRDTVRIDCDEILRQVRARFRFAARDTVLRFVDTTAYLVRQEPSRWGLSVGAGYGATLGASAVALSPGIWAGVTYTFIRF